MIGFVKRNQISGICKGRFVNLIVVNLDLEVRFCFGGTGSDRGGVLYGMVVV